MRCGLCVDNVWVMCVGHNYVGCVCDVRTICGQCVSDVWGICEQCSGGCVGDARRCVGYRTAQQLAAGYFDVPILASQCLSFGPIMPPVVVTVQHLPHHRRYSLSI